MGDTGMEIKLGIVITFFYREHRLDFLSKVLQALNNISYNKDITVISNMRGPIFTHICDISDPLMLPWSHVDYMRKYYENETYTHFLYLEDDIEVNQNNIDYWIYHRNLIDNKLFFPAFIRAEKLYNHWYAVDIMSTHTEHTIKRYSKNYINLSDNHQGMYMMDRVMMKEYLSSMASKPPYGTGRHKGIIESSAEGLLYHNVPEGYYSRNLIHFKYNMPDINGIIHHCSDSYVTNRDVPVAKILVKDCICV